ncbi:MAG: acyl-CoA desaturase, partial [Myxococcota bacterium]
VKRQRLGLLDALCVGNALCLHRLSNVAFAAIHLAPLGLLYTGLSRFDVALCVALYFVRMFFITAGYHRYFSHRAYKMGRFMQFLMALGGSLCANKGVLWWAAHHRNHHRHSDSSKDAHTPQKGLYESHVGWIFRDDHVATDYDRVKDLARFPELVWLNKNHTIVLTLLGVACFAAGGWSEFLSGFCLSTVLLWHGVFTINSLAHLWGTRRFPTNDDSRNNFWLALITLGEGWHNNHHYYQSSANQGFFWWEVDITYTILKLMRVLGLVHGLRRPPSRVLNAAAANRTVEAVRLQR